MTTKNFKVNSLANHYSFALYRDITARNGGDWFDMTVGNKTVKVAIIDGVKGIRQLVDNYFLAALKLDYPRWEDTAIKLFSLCVVNGYLTGYGRELWQSMINDMSEALAQHGGFHEIH